jgi:hypothetical protein
MPVGKPGLAASTDPVSPRLYMPLSPVTTVRDQAADSPGSMKVSACPTFIARPRGPLFVRTSGAFDSVCACLTRQPNPDGSIGPRQTRRYLVISAAASPHKERHSQRGQRCARGGNGGKARAATMKAARVKTPAFENHGAQTTARCRRCLPRELPAAGLADGMRGGATASGCHWLCSRLIFRSSASQAR